MAPINIGLVGFGKIARDQHLPAIQANAAYRLVAIADPCAELPGVASYAALTDMLEGSPELDAVAICTPPSLRYSQARLALQQGKQVLLEKPPGATLSEVDALIKLAERQRTTLFAAWHSRFASGVGPAREWLAARDILNVEIEWKEDVRVWHPGQEWIWKAGGMGVFDPGINALSIVTAILPQPFALREATLWVPSNCQTPIAADLNFRDAFDRPIKAAFDFRQIGPQKWNIHIDTDQGPVHLSEGGSRLSIAGNDVMGAMDCEYAALYAHFAELISRQLCDVDVTPLRHVADAFLYGHRESVAAFSPSST